VKAVARGERYLDAQTAQAQALALALALAVAVAQIDGEANPVDLLSEREFSVFIQLARGMSVAQIAKLGAGNQFELTLVALRWGLIEA
jgi:two-component system invasion response regulator UvrY